MKAPTIANAPKSASGAPANLACVTRPSQSSPTRQRCILAFVSVTPKGRVRQLVVADLRLEMN